MNYEEQILKGFNLNNPVSPEARLTRGLKRNKTTVREESSLKSKTSFGRYRAKTDKNE